MKTVSIIVPVYNVEKYLNRCVDSILNQTFKDFELILINDGSTDSSGEMLKEYETLENVRIVHQENKGLALTRNVGLSIAKGKYVMFIDSDDSISADYVEAYVTAIEHEKCDVVMGGFTRICDGKVDFIRKAQRGKFAKYIIPASVSKIYRRAFLEEHNILFSNIKSEDVDFSMLFIKHRATYGFIDNVGYYYYSNPNSISNTAHRGFKKDYNIFELIERFNFEDVDDILLHQYFIVRFCIYFLLYSGKSAESKAFTEEYKRYFAWLKENLSHYSQIKFSLFGPDGEDKSVGLIVFIFMLLHRLRLVPLFAKIYCRPGSKLKY